MDFKNIDEKRLHYNLEILSLLEKVVRKHPYLRFEQVLRNVLIPEAMYHREPDKTLQMISDQVDKSEYL
jgi:hypothetical protein